MSSTRRRRYQNDYKTPTPVQEPLIPLSEMVRRIERVRASEGVGSRVRPLPPLFGLAPYRSGRAQDIDERRSA